MNVAEAVRSPAEYEERLQKYLYERSEEGRAVRVGEKETSEQAAMVARYADLFSREQLEALREQEERSRDDELENAILAARVDFKGDRIPLRTAQAQLAVLESYADHAQLAAIYREGS